MSGTEGDGGGAYFRAIEERFIRLRGAPLLLSPADWQAARRWHAAGVPLPLVLATLEEVFRRRRERGARGRIQSLRYCADAVEAAWAEAQELAAAGHRTQPLRMNMGRRLDALAGALPDLPGVERLAGVVRRLSGPAAEVEEALARLDAEALDLAAAALSEESRRALDREVQATLDRVARRVPASERAEVGRRLRAQLLRRRAGLPLLSLFAPEAEETGGDDGGA